MCVWISADVLSPPQTHTVQDKLDGLTQLPQLKLGRSLQAAAADQWVCEPVVDVGDELDFLSSADADAAKARRSLTPLLLHLLRPHSPTHLLVPLFTVASPSHSLHSLILFPHPHPSHILSPHSHPSHILSPHSLPSLIHTLMSLSPGWNRFFFFFFCPRCCCCC
jgi:hypothetical protein